ncbi:MAG: kelch repeat-containing protein, partial [Bacteroidota bacterium]
MKQSTLIVLLIQGFWINIASQSTSEFSPARFLGTSIVVGDSAYFAGGAGPNLISSDAINIYDSSTDTWYTDQLLMPRALLSSAATNRATYFAGGQALSSGNASNIIEIFERQTDELSFDTLSVPRTNVMAVGMDSLVFFAGGHTISNGLFGTFTGNSVIDIYHENTNTWSQAELSEARGAGAAVRVGDYIIFAGGLINDTLASKRVDIYHVPTDSWSIDSLSNARFFLSGVSDDHAAYFAGGQDVDNTHFADVDIYTPEDGTWETTNLSLGRVGMSSGYSCGKVIFAGGANSDWSTRFVTTTYDQVDVYDPTTNQWDTTQLVERRYGAMPAAFEDQFIIASGFSISGGWLESLVNLDC